MVASKPLSEGPLPLPWNELVSFVHLHRARDVRARVVGPRVVEQRDATLRLSIRGDGVGGADPAAAAGLTGLRDRAEAIGGTISVKSPIGAGTRVLVSLPLG